MGLGKTGGGDDIMGGCGGGNLELSNAECDGLLLLFSLGGKGAGGPRLNPRKPPAPPPSSPYEVMTVMSVTTELVSSEPSDESESSKRFLLALRFNAFAMVVAEAAAVDCGGADIWGSGGGGGALLLFGAESRLGGGGMPLAAYMLLLPLVLLIIIESL